LKRGKSRKTTSQDEEEGEGLEAAAPSRRLLAKINAGGSHMGKTRACLFFLNL